MGAGTQSYLIYSTRNESWDVCLAIEDLRESCTKGCGCLDSWETDLANTITVTKTKDALGLVEGHTLLNAADRSVESRHLTVTVVIIVTLQ